MTSKSHILMLAVVCGLLVLAPIQLARSQVSSGTVVAVVPSQNSVRVGQTLTVNITVSNVQNLYGIDAVLDWNSSALQVVTATSWLGVESHTNGVLHESSGSPILVVEDNSTQEIGEYHLVATSEAPADSFNGSGTIATLTFNVTSMGHSELKVTSELADHPLPSETTSELIAHTDIGASVDAAAIPEFPEIAVLSLLLVSITLALLFTKKRVQEEPRLNRISAGTVSQWRAVKGEPLALFNLLVSKR